jgi:hypothetical protein
MVRHSFYLVCNSVQSAEIIGPTFLRTRVAALTKVQYEFLLWAWSRGLHTYEGIGTLCPLKDTVPEEVVGIGSKFLGSDDVI